MAYQTLIYEQKESTGIITLSRPERLNALNRQLFMELNSLLDDVEADRAVRVVLITGAGRAFSAGADIKERVEYEDNLEMQRSLGGPVFRRLERLDKIIVAVINGYAVGGGCELALACDLRIASDQARFSQPEVKLGILPGSGGTQRLPRLIGVARALEMMLLGEPITARQALEWGLVNRVVPHASLMVEALGVARALATQAPQVLPMIKSTVGVGMSTDLDSGLAYERRCSDLLNSTEDRRVGMRAFVEKRAPVFQGR